MDEDTAQEIYYHKNGAEAEFLLKEKVVIKQWVQVCYDIEDPETKRRDLKSMRKASMELECSGLLCDHLGRGREGFR